MKKLVLSFILLLMPCILFAQQAPKIEWQQCIGGTLSEDASPVLQTIIQTSDGGFAIAGSTNSNDGDILSNHGSEDALIIKLNPSGAMQWQKCLGGYKTDVAVCIIETADKGFAIAGYTNSTDGDVSGLHGTSIDAWIVKLDSLGKIQWQKCIGGSATDAAYSIIQTSDGGYAVAGNTASNDGDFEGKNHGGNGDAWIAKMDSSGVIIWTNCYGGSAYDAASSIIQNFDGGFTVAGFTTSDGEGFNNHSLYEGDAYIFRIDPSGTIMKTSHTTLWQKLLGGTGGDVANSILHTSDGGYLFSGSTSSNNGDVSGNHGGLDAWIVKLDSDGTIIWQKCFGGTNGERAATIIKTIDGGYAFVGTTSSNNGDVSGNHVGTKDSSDIWVVKLTSAGVIEWQKCLGGTKADEGFAIIQTTDGGFAVSGRTLSNDNDVSGNHGDEDIWVIKLGAAASVNSTSSQTNFAWVFPNPSNDLAHLYLFQSQPVKQIQFYNLLGLQFYPEYQVENNLLSIDEHNLPIGSYIVRVSYFNIGSEEVRKFLRIH